MAIGSNSTHGEPERKEKESHRRSTPIPTEQASQSLPSLPPEILADILLRLSVKHLLRFRSVCKSWLSLISDPKFVNFHLSMVSKSDEYYTHRRLILSSILPNFSLTCSLSSPMYEQSDHAVELDYPFEQRHRPVRIVGSCNGLVCFGNDQEDYMFLWNLSTRKVKRLQDPGVGFVYDSSRVCGFGYDKSNDDYKVVTSRCVFGDGGALEKTELMVQSLRTNSWRRIAGCPLIIALGRTGKFVSGSLHWLAFTMNRSKVIVSVDLAYETGGEVVQPSYGDGPFALTLEVLSGWLCVLCDFYGYRTDVWVMKEYGMRESWTKLFTIPYLTNPMSFFHSTPLAISNNGEILLQFGPHVALYNPIDGSFRYPVINNVDCCFDMNTYVESLISPNIDDEVQRQQQ